ncbi:hypothetical protein BDV95DRAFT_573866 [Massariosphaeria phaeospora]|uniref:Uncharacterized protein n=1 Tax=Massariosphaeria phaeospora TaxID=100035 RepID=A0A7C8I466_9PLEO|nr:hypothetical protein BDV95DRAFT_573866 [Massariosphaeria phaeospora]
MKMEATRSAPTPPQLTPTAIQELQDAFGTLVLQLPKDNTPVPPRSPILPTWTGPFRLFSLPRELRDHIYHAILYRPAGVCYQLGAARTWGPPWTDNISLTFFLTSRQVHAEAVQTFYAYNTIRLKYHIDLAPTLQLLLPAPGALIQRVQIESVSAKGRGTGPKREGPSGIWDVMIQEARRVEAAFPACRECATVWKVRIWILNARHADDARQTLYFDGKTPAEKVQTWLEWMREWYVVDGAVPPRCMRVKFDTTESEEDQRAIDEALELFKKEVSGSRADMVAMVWGSLSEKLETELLA